MSFVEQGDKRTVKSLGRKSNVRNTKIECEDDKEWKEVDPRARSSVREENLKERKARVHRMMRDVGPTWDPT